MLEGHLAFSFAPTVSRLLLINFRLLCDQAYSGKVPLSQELKKFCFQLCFLLVCLLYFFFPEWSNISRAYTCSCAKTVSLGAE